MDPKRVKAHMVPIIKTTKARRKPAVRRLKDDADLEDTLLRALDIDRQTDRAFSRDSTGKIEIPRTACWKRFYERPYHHVLSCGHDVTTEDIVACGFNCLKAANAERDPEGNIIKCKRCIDKKLALPFIPRKKARNLFQSAVMGYNAPGDRRDTLDVSQDEKAKDNELRKQLVEAFGSHKQSKTVFEPLKAPAPRKGRAVDEPGFDLHDRLTGEYPGEDVSNYEDIEQPDDLPLQKRKDKTSRCPCKSSYDLEMLHCSWCDAYYHPTCVGYGKLDRSSFLNYANDFVKFYCADCKKDRAEADALTKEETRAAKAAVARNRPKSVAKFMAELRGDRSSQRGVTSRKKVLKDRVKIGRNGHVGKKREVKKSIKADLDIEDVEEVTSNRSQTHKIATQEPVSIFEEQGKDEPKAPRRRFTLSDNKFTKKAARENLACKNAAEFDSMDVDD